MLRWLWIRIVQSVLVLLVVVTLVFGLSRLSGDPVNTLLRDDATPEDVANLKRVLGLDQPLPVQYVLYLSNAARGDFGNSLRTRRPVIELIQERLPASLQLAAFSMILALCFSLPLGILAAVKKGRALDSIAKIVAVLGQSMPSFWLALMLVILVSSRVQFLPAAGMDGWNSFILPGLTLGWFVTAGIMRLLRSAMLDVLDSDYIKMARMKGVSERSVVWKHALRNAMIPVVTFTGMYFALQVSMAVTVETVFAWPGMGRLAYEAIASRDFPVIQGVVLVLATVVTGTNLIVDVLYAYLDPRIKYA